MHRREFIKQTGAAALASASGPFVHASDKAAAKSPIVGEGEHRYECHHQWGEVPGSIHFPGRYSAGIGWSGRSESQKMVTTHHRLPSKKSWILLIPRTKGLSSSACRDS
jgi:hypothetical protein